MERTCFNFDVEIALRRYGATEAQERQLLVDDADLIAACVGD